MNKIAQYKEAIREEAMEKVALNAQKARQMAKQTGLVPIGNWKGALRNMRNMKTGELLTGKELAQAKAKIGSLSNNAYQKLKTEQRKLPSNTEMAGIVSRKTGDIKSLRKGEARAGAVNASINGKLTNMHTHPVEKGEDRFGIITKSMREMSSGPIKHEQFSNADENLTRFINQKGSGALALSKGGMKDVMKPRRNPLIVDAGGGHTYLDGHKTSGKSKISGDNNTRKKINKELNDITNNGDADYNKRRKLSKLINRNYNSSLADGMKKGTPLTSGDMSEFIAQHLEGKGQKQTIVNTKQDYEAIHKISPYKKSSVFFDRSPRKTRKG